jgi:hypothetical protein
LRSPRESCHGCIEILGDAYPELLREGARRPANETTQLLVTELRSLGDDPGTGSAVAGLFVDAIENTPV